MLCLLPWKAKEFEEILDDDIMESLKTLFVEEQMKSVENATMM